MILKKSIFILLAVWMACGSAFAGDAVKGYDVVSYFTDSKAEKGYPRFQTEWNGMTWSFVSESHKKMFAANPPKYAPQYGGYCAYAMSKGSKAPSDPTAWTVVNGKLYLNYNVQVKALWNKDQAQYIEAADKNWSRLNS